MDRDKAPSGFNTNKNYDLHSLLNKDFKETKTLNTSPNAVPVIPRLHLRAISAERKRFKKEKSIPAILEKSSEEKNIEEEKQPDLKYIIAV